jgi:hypothetical protein
MCETSTFDQRPVVQWNARQDKELAVCLGDKVHHHEKQNEFARMLCDDPAQEPGLWVNSA